MTSHSIVQSSPRQGPRLPSQSTEVPPVPTPEAEDYRFEPRAGHKRIQAITRDLMSTYNRINADYYAKNQDGFLRKAMQAMPDQNKADKILRKLGVYFAGNLKVAIIQNDIAKAVAAFNEARLDIENIKQAIDAMHPPKSQSLPDEATARQIVNSLGAYWSGNLKEAILEADFNKALNALDSSRNDIRILSEAISALHPRDLSSQSDPLKAEIAVQSLGAYFVGELQLALEAGNLSHALLCLERMRNDIVKLEEAMEAARPHLSTQAPDLAKAESIINQLGFHFIGRVKRAVLKGSLDNAVKVLEQRRIDNFQLLEAIKAFHPSGVRIAPDQEKVKSALQRLDVRFNRSMERALETGDLEVCLEALDDCRTDVYHMQEAIFAIRPQDKKIKPDRAKAEYALSILQMKFEGAIKAAVETGDLNLCLNLLDSIREDRRKFSYAQGKVIGKGSYGEVSEGTHSSGMLVAIKKTKLDKKEAETLALLHRHGVPHVVFPLEVFASSPEKVQHTNIVMPKQTVIKDGLVLPLNEVCSMALQGEEFLRGMQRVNMMHNDIKRPNMGWQRSSHYLSFFDFGMACPTDDPKLSNTKAVLHTAFWRAPEVLLGRYPLDRTMDYFSWGITLVEFYLGRHLFPCNDNSMEGIRQHVLAWQDQIGDPPEEYLAQCPPKRLAKIYEMENGKPKRDAGGKLIIRKPHLPRLDPTPWQERMRALAKSQGDDLTRLEALIHHIEGLMTYAGRRELREVNFYPNLSMHLDQTLHPDQAVQIYPADATDSTPPLLTIKGGMPFSCLHIPVNAPSASGKFRITLYEQGKRIGTRDIVIREGEWVDFGFRKREPLTISPLRPKVDLKSGPHPTLPASGSASQSASQTSTAAYAPKLSKRRLQFDEKKEEKKDKKPDAREEHQLRLSPSWGQLDRELQRQKDRDGDKDEDRDGPIHFPSARSPQDRHKRMAEISSALGNPPKKTSLSAGAAPAFSLKLGKLDRELERQKDRDGDKD